MAWLASRPSRGVHQQVQGVGIGFGRAQQRTFSGWQRPSASVAWLASRASSGGRWLGCSVPVSRSACAGSTCTMRTAARSCCRPHPRHSSVCARTHPETQRQVTLRRQHLHHAHRRQVLLPPAPAAQQRLRAHAPRDTASGNPARAAPAPCAPPPGPAAARTRGTAASARAHTQDGVPQVMGMGSTTLICRHCSGAVFVGLHMMLGCQDSTMARKAPGFPGNRRLLLHPSGTLYGLLKGTSANTASA